MAFLKECPQKVGDALLMQEEQKEEKNSLFNTMSIIRN
jgi:hypothetical protein